MSIWTFKRYLRPICRLFGHARPLSDKQWADLIEAVDRVSGPFRGKIPNPKLDDLVIREKELRQRYDWCSRCGLKLGRRT